MKRAPIIMFGTVAGLAGVFSFHTSPAKISLGPITTTPPTTTPPTTTPPTTSTPTTTTPRSSSSPTTSTTPVHDKPPATTTTVAPSAGQATGASVNYYFGILSVKVTVANAKISNVSIAAINDGGNSRSVSIDQYSIPLLEQEALRAQSANIQSVSGASYTSAGFAQSLQSALSKLGRK
ncbi:MAG TPA: FMN-binding protein [Acidimicrobiales bacterium]|nr:FMN-binding protein [Acidimicrobiales bacterium]